jgi:hypothetical protein
LGLVQACEHRLGVRHQGAAGVGEPDRSDAAFDEPGGGLALASRHLLADRRRRERERLGRERAAAGDLPGELEPATPQGSGGR